MRGLVVCSLFAACATPGAVSPKPVVPAEERSCARRTENGLPQRVADARQGSAIAMAGSQAYVADADSRALHTIDLDGRRELGRTRLDGSPRQIVVLADGRLVVTLPDANRIAVLEPAADPSKPMATLCERALPDEPWGIALSADDASLVVTSAWGAALSVLDGATFLVKRTVSTLRDPRAVLVEGNTAWVSHVVGAKMSAIEIDTGKTTEIDLALRKSTPLAQPDALKRVRTGSQGHAIARVSVNAKSSRILEPHVSVDPGDPERRATYYGPPFDGVPKESPTVSVVDPETKTSLAKHLLGTVDKAYARECLLPRAAVALGGKLYVACFGIDSVLELDALAADPILAETRRFAVPAGPEGLALDGSRMVVFSQLAATVSIVRLDGGAIAKIALDYHPDPAIAEAALGRQLFYRTDDHRITEDGLACASCHIDGRDDGITWSTPFGPRQTPMLAGRLAATAPYGWDGLQPNVSGYVAHTIQNLGGVGLDDADLANLEKFVMRVKGPAQAGAVDRGRTTFEQRRCGACHTNGGTDGHKHTASIETLDTPSLQFVRGTAPYFHDGRYRTLEELLGDKDSVMGETSLLSTKEQADLAAYLRSL